jgi:citrate lyase subunit beta / citryl-CoA lyase
MNNRPRRSLLYMPGSNIRALEKARTLSADGFIFDLEDAVAPSAKELARTQIAAAVRQGGYGGREIIIRVNGLDTEWWRQDMAAIATLPVDGVLFPKINSPEQIHTAVAALDKAGAPLKLPVWIMAETPACILRIDAIAGSHPRLAGIMMGTADLAKELRASHTPDRRTMVTHLHLCVLAARAHGLSVIDGVHFDLEDEAGFKTVCEQGREIGFDGKTLIHPNQIDIANRVFAPSEAEVHLAQTLVAAWEQATAEGKGVTVVNGRLVEKLHVEEARRILALDSVIKATR